MLCLPPVTLSLAVTLGSCGACSCMQEINCLFSITTVQDGCSILQNRDLKGPEWGNSTTPSATKDRWEERWLAFGRRACISCVGPDGSVIKFCSGLRYYWDFCSRHSIPWYLCHFHWVGPLCQNLAWETFKLFWGKNSQRCSGFVFKFKVAFKQG